MTAPVHPQMLTTNPHTQRQLTLATERIYPSWVRRHNRARRWVCREGDTRASGPRFAAKASRTSAHLPNCLSLTTGGPRRLRALPPGAPLRRARGTVFVLRSVYAHIYVLGVPTVSL